MTVDNDREYPGGSQGDGESEDEWFFDLPQGAWERQEAKRRQLRDRLLSQAGEVEPPPPRKDPFGTASEQAGPPLAGKQRPSRWGIFRRGHETGSEEPIEPAFRASDFYTGDRPPEEATDSPADTGRLEDDGASEPDQEATTLWDAHLQANEDPLEAMRRWAQREEPAGDGDGAESADTVVEAEATPPAHDPSTVEARRWDEAFAAAKEDPIDAMRRWASNDADEEDEAPLVDLEATQPATSDEMVEDEFEPWAKDLLAADEQPPPQAGEKRGLLGKLFSRRGDDHEPDIDRAIAEAEVSGGWVTTSAMPGDPPVAATTPATESPASEPMATAAPEPAEGGEPDPWAEFLRTREAAEDTVASRDSEDPDPLPFAKGSSTGESADEAAPGNRVEEPEPPFAPAEPAATASAWEGWDAGTPDNNDETPATPGLETVEPAATTSAWEGWDASTPDNNDETPATAGLEPVEPAATASAWEGWDADTPYEDETSTPSAEAEPVEPAATASAWEDWDAGTPDNDETSAIGAAFPQPFADAGTGDEAESAAGWDDWKLSVPDAGEESVAATGATGDAPGASARDAVWDAIAADRADDDEIGVFLRAPGVTGGRRLHQQPDPWDDTSERESLDAAAEAHAGDAGEEAITGRPDHAWMVEDEEEDIIVRAFEEHAASAMDDENKEDQPSRAERDAALRALLGEDVTTEPISDGDDDIWTPHRVVESEDTGDTDFLGDEGPVDEEWHEDEPPWSRNPAAAANGDGPPPARGSRTRTLVRELVETGLLALLVFLAVRASFQNFRVEGESMYPTLEDGQYVIVNKLVYSEVDMERLSDFVPVVNAEQGETRHLFHAAKRGEIIVFHSPRDPSEDLIKRVIALPGETIEIVDGNVYVNDYRLDEPYITTPWHGNHPKILIPEDQYFVMGDNRNNSQDSRSPQVGLVHEDMIVGKVTLSYWPASKFGLGPNGGPQITDERRPAAVAAAQPSER